MKQEQLQNDLNPAQLEAAQTLSGPLLILAGAGSGKTRVLTYRVANLILQGEATPGQILAVTFTNKAAREMGTRIEALLHKAGVPIHEEMWISTFHSFCARFLREEIHRLGYQPFFVIYDDSDQLSMIKRICEDLNLNDKVYLPKNIRHMIGQAKMLALTPERVATSAFFRMDETTLEIYRLYEDEMKRANAVDFDDLLLKTYTILHKYPEVLEAYQDKFHYVLVDEYQDTNHIQYLIVKALAQKHRNICVVGDEDQSIYSWRGADIKNILDFEKDFPETKIVKLEENYRSTKNIVEAASHVIAKNTQRKNKTLFTNNAHGTKIVIQAERNEYDEARFVARKVQELILAGRHDRSAPAGALNDVAVFYRTNAQSRVLEEQLRSESLPYRVIGTVKFYERKEIKDVICYMRLILNTNDDVAFFRVVNTPARGIGRTTLDEILKFATQNKMPAYEAAQEVAVKRMVNSGACNKLQNFRFLIEKLRTEAANLTPSEIYLRILDETQYAMKLKQENTPEAQARIENLEEFQNALLQFEHERDEDEATLTAFLEEMALISDADRDNPEQDAVTLMTLHLSKGLEFKNVFIVGLEEGLFPSGQSLDENEADRLEEERRLCYVGMTRARENLFLTYARSRRVYGQEETRPHSRFLAEIPEKYVLANASLKQPAFMNSFLEKMQSAGQTRKTCAEPTHWADDSFSNDSFEDSSQTRGDFKRGQRVRHPIFGVGSIFQVEGSGDQIKVSVLFADKSLKKFMAKHARLELI